MIDEGIKLDCIRGRANLATRRLPPKKGAGVSILETAVNIFAITRV
jgi:hypothetical protein